MSAGLRGLGITAGARAACFAALLLPACLPKGSLARRDEVEADLYALSMDVAVRTEGLDVAPFTWHLEGTVGWSFTRQFRDGSMGHLVRLDGLTATTTREGAAPVVTPVALEGAFVEVRAFPDGQLLTVAGTSPWIGNPGHLEVVDVLWPVLSPHLPPSRKEAAAPFTSSWPTWVEGGPKVRTRLVAQWAGDGPAWTYAGTLAGEGGYVKLLGRAEGAVTLGEGDTRLRSHTFAWTRTVTTTWPGGATVTQEQRIDGKVEHQGAGASPPLDMPLATDDLSADARPLHLRDGRKIEERPVDAASALPFLLLPDDLPPDEQARLRAALTQAGSM